MEALLNSSINTIQHLDLGSNPLWFKIRYGYDFYDNEEAVEMLTEVISKQTSSLQILNLNANYF